jgi:L-2,4-diaminobutyrate decarboxylase
MGRQFSGVVPLAGVVDFVSSIVNQPSSFYEAGQLPNVVERLMAEEFNQFIGWEPEQFAMVTTSGGSLANLTAILAARNDKFPDFWAQGAQAYAGQARPAIAVGADAHYSVSRAAGILGIGDEQIVRLPLNDKYQICMEQVRPALAAARARGLRVFCLVASAGTTSVGAFDPLPELAQVAREQDIWLHVDGAHGASLLVSDQLRGKLQGLAQADSFVLDAHKMLFVPAMCTLLFYKDKAKSYGAFRQDASYVFEKNPDIYTEFDSAEKNFECTKRPLIMNLWVLWVLYGKRLFADKLEQLCRMTQEAYQILNAEADFQTLHQPEANILCFRYLPDNADAVSPDFQVVIRNRIRSAGKFFISKVNIDGKGALRVVFMNHLTTAAHFRSLLDDIRHTGQTLITDGNLPND